jgi:hypothetical protein
LAVQRFFTVDRHQQVKEFDPTARFGGTHTAIPALREGLGHTRIAVRKKSVNAKTAVRLSSIYE